VPLTDFVFLKTILYIPAKPSESNWVAAKACHMWLTVCIRESDKEVY